MPQIINRVAVLPPDCKLGFQPGGIALDDLIWPFGQSVETKGRQLSDLNLDDHLIVLPRRSIHFRPLAGIKARVSVAIFEPEAIHGHHMKMLRWSHKRFHRVLTCNQKLLRDIPNGVFFPFGSTWLDEHHLLNCAKTKMCSLIASSKNSQPGHILRHEIASWVRGRGTEVDLIGRGYKAFGDKSEGLAPYRYSIVIENVREPNFFTEKLIDALLCKTVPIYWGCPNINAFLDTDGMILCNTADDIRRAIGQMSEQDYKARLPAIEAIQSTAESFGNVWQRAGSALQEAGRRRDNLHQSLPRSSFDVSADVFEKTP